MHQKLYYTVERVLLILRTARSIFQFQNNLINWIKLHLPRLLFQQGMGTNIWRIQLPCMPANLAWFGSCDLACPPCSNLPSNFPTSTTTEFVSSREIFYLGTWYQQWSKQWSNLKTKFRAKHSNSHQILGILSWNREMSSMIITNFIRLWDSSPRGFGFVSY